MARNSFPLIALISLTTLFLTGCEPESPLQEVDLVINNVHVLTMIDGGEVENAQVVIDDGNIIAVSTAPVTASYSGALEIDGSDKYLMPGLIDAHVHIVTPFDAPLYPASGVTTVRNMWGFPLHLELRRNIAAGAVFGPEIITSGQLLDGEPRIWPQSSAPDSREAVRDLLVENKEAGYDFIKIYSRVSTERFEDIMEIAAELDVTVVGHVPNEITMPDAARAGMKSFEHLWEMPGMLQPGESHVVFDPLQREQWDTVDLAKLDEVIDVIVEEDVWIVPTLMVLEHIYLLGSPDMVIERARGLEYMHPAMLEFWEAGSRGRPVVTPEVEAWVNDVLALRGKIVKRLHERGANLLIGSDSNNAFVVHGFSLIAEMDKFVEAGISRADVLQIATADSARFLELEQRIGTLSVGMEADLILLDGDPRQSFDVFKNSTGVVVNGTYYAREDLEVALLGNRDAAEAAARQFLGGGNAED